MLLTIQISILLLYNKKKKMDLLFFQKKKNPKPTRVDDVAF